MGISATSQVIPFYTGWFFMTLMTLMTLHTCFPDYFWIYQIIANKSTNKWMTLIDQACHVAGIRESNKEQSLNVLFISLSCSCVAIGRKQKKNQSYEYMKKYIYIYIYIVIFIYLFIYSFICSYSYMNKSHVPGVKHQLRRNRRPFTIKRRSRMMRIRKTLTIRISRIKRQNLRTWWQSPQDMVIS